LTMYLPSSVNARDKETLRDFVKIRTELKFDNLSL
jgi:hypothetical protein